MSKAFTRSNYCVSLLLIISVFLTGLLPLTSFAKEQKRKPVVVSFGQPNIWSLEQAHYLLARMHMANLDLQAKTLTATDLDANAVNGTRIQLLRQLFGVDVEFDQGIGFQNRRLVENERFNDNRRRELLTRRDKSQDDSLALTREISRLEIEKARMDANPAATAEEKAVKQKEIDAKKDEQAAVKEQITQQNDELKTLLAEPSGTPTSPSASASPASLPPSALEKLIEKNADKLLDAAKDPKLNASTMLDNTIQLQYEIIAKQLTLLRDEVGPGERLVFLELPQSIYTTPGSGDEKMAQAWWHVNGYTRTDPLLHLLLEFYDLEQRWHDIQRVPAFRTFVIATEFRECPADSAQPGSAPTPDQNLKQVYDALKAEHEIARKRIIELIFREANVNFDRVEQNGARDTSETIEAVRKRVFLDGGLLTPRRWQQPPATESTEHQYVQTIKWQLLNILSQKNPDVCDRQTYSLDQGLEVMRLDEQADAPQRVKDIKRRTIRTVDIIPRQSSLNVNDIQDTVKQTGILAGFKFLFGLAGTVDFQRQREQFEQFLHQELYASGFGKGDRDFGWTFGALPGTKRVAPGVRTTYAALIVPDDAESIVMSARGCYFPRKNYQPLDFKDTSNGDWTKPEKFKDSNCGDDENYILSIPGGGNTSDFWVTNIDYQEGQNSGDFETVSVRGNNFSSQIGVLINGVPLLPTVGLAHPYLMPKSTNGAAPAVASDCTNVQGICGRFERIDPQQLVFSFRMQDGFKGIPTITLVAPGKSVDLNSILNVRINRISNVTLKDDGAFMFGKRPSRVAITDVQLLNIDANSGDVEALVEGRGFNQFRDRVYVNNVEVTGADLEFKSAGLYKLTFPRSSLDTLEFKIVQANEVATKFLPNPGSMEIISATVVSYDPPVPKKSPGVMTVKLQVAGPSQRLSIYGLQGATASRLVPGASSGEAIVRLIDPDPTVVITIIDRGTYGVASVAVQRPKEPPKPAEQPTPKPKEEPKPKTCLVPVCTAN